MFSDPFRPSAHHPPWLLPAPYGFLTAISILAHRLKSCRFPSLVCATCPQQHVVWHFFQIYFLQSQCSQNVICVTDTETVNRHCFPNSMCRKSTAIFWGACAGKAEKHNVPHDLKQSILQTCWFHEQIQPRVMETLLFQNYAVSWVLKPQCFHVFSASETELAHKACTLRGCHTGHEPSSKIYKNR